MPFLPFTSHSESYLHIAFNNVFYGLQMTQILVSSTCNTHLIVDPFKGQVQPELYINIQHVPRTKHSFSVIKNHQLTVYNEIPAVCSEICTNHSSSLCRKTVEFITVQPGDASNHWALSVMIQLAVFIVLFRDSEDS